MPDIRERLETAGCRVPLVGDFHYNGHRLLTEYPACAEALAKYRINPGNVGFREKRDRQFQTMIEVALKYDRPVRIGVNWGSLDQDLLASTHGRKRGSARAQGCRRGHARGPGRVWPAQCGASRRDRARAGQDRDLGQGLAGAGPDRRLRRTRPRAATMRSISGSPRRAWAPRASWPPPPRSRYCSSGASATPVRISLTPEPGGDRTQEVIVAQEILQTMGFRSFVPLVAACPGCGRTTSTVFQGARRAHPGLRAPADADMARDL